eukprot:jgi/Galph1/6063/GphlegSOOS_G4716.1
MYGEFIRKRCSDEFVAETPLLNTLEASRFLAKLPNEQSEDTYKRAKLSKVGVGHLTNEALEKVVIFSARNERHAALRNEILEKVQLRSHLVNLLQLANGSTAFVCQLVDVNIFASNILQLLSNSDSARLHSLNIQCHSFSITADKKKLLEAFCGSYVRKGKVCNIVAYVLQTLFGDDLQASICVVEGSGVACVLLADFCHLYGLVDSFGAENGWPSLLVLTGFPSGRNFLLTII